MISKFVVIAVLCVTYTLAEAPRYRSQRFRQAPSRNFFARQEAPYPDAIPQGGEPASAYGPPSSPRPVYGAPPTPRPVYGSPSGFGDPEITNESINPDSEALSAQPSRLTKFEKLTLPTKKSPQKFSQQKLNPQFSQRLELQQQVQQFPTQQQFVAPVQTVQPIQPISPFQSVFASPYQLPAVQEGSYYIQLPNGAIERVNYFTQPSAVDNSVLAKLQFRPVAEVPVAEIQTTVAEPQLFVNTLVQSHITTDE